MCATSRTRRSATRCGNERVEVASSPFSSARAWTTWRQRPALRRTCGNDCTGAGVQPADERLAAQQLEVGSDALVATEAHQVVVSGAEPDHEAFENLVEEILDEYGPLFQALAKR